MVARFTQFMRETGLELKRVSWPSVNELKESTVVVLVTVLVIAIMLYVVDKVLESGVGLLVNLL